MIFPSFLASNLESQGRSRLNDALTSPMDNPVYLDEDIPFVESGDYEIDEAAGVGSGHSTNLSHNNVISLNDDPLWSSSIPAKRGRRPKPNLLDSGHSVGEKLEPKRRGRRAKQDTTLLTVNDQMLSDSTDALNQKHGSQQSMLAGMRSAKRIKTNGQEGE
jgi:hypothetical protein